MSWLSGSHDIKGARSIQFGHKVIQPDYSDHDGVHAQWNGNDDGLTVSVDPLGYYSLFVFQKGDSISVSPSILQLIAMGADTTLDDRALGVFYRLGLFINNDTPFKFIKVLPPGGRLTWSRGKMTVSGAAYIPKVRDISRNDAVDGIIDLTRQSLKNILETWSGDFLLPLSGGRDSRHILLELDHLGALPKACITFHHSGSHFDSESLAARAICESVGARHQIIGARRVRSRDALRAIALTSLCSDEHVQMFGMHDFLAGSPDAALDGIAGDILTNPDDWADGYYRQAAAGDFHGVARDMMAGHSKVLSKPGHRGGAGSLYSPDNEAEVTAYLADAMEGFSEAADPYQAFWFWNRTRREINFVTTSILGNAGAVFCPYLDRRFVDFCLSLPYEITKNQQLHNDAISRAYPNHSGIPFADQMTPPAPQRAKLLSKITKTLRGFETILALKPDAPMRELKEYLTGSQYLHRAPAETLRLHSLVLSRIDADFARYVLDLAKRYRDVAAPDQITNTFEPEQTNEH